MFRSREMTYCQVLLPQEALYNCVAGLGEIGRVQFKDVIKNLLFSTLS